MSIQNHKPSHRNNFPFKQPRRALPLLIGLVILLTQSEAQAWPAVGVVVSDPSMRSATPAWAVPDGSGGTLVLMSVNPAGSSNPDVYLQRLDRDGNLVPGWANGGIPIAIGALSQQPVHLVGDGLGGAFVAYSDLARGRDLYLQRVLPDGTIPSPWPVGGALVGAGAGRQDSGKLVPDGSGGVFLAWEDTRNSATTGVDIYHTRIQADGSVAPGRTIGGEPLATAPGSQSLIHMLAGENGSCFIFWSSESPSGVIARGIRLLPDGTPAPGWPIGGKSLFTAPIISNAVVGVVSDARGGAIVTVSNDFTGTGNFFEYRAARVLPDGSLDPRWLQADGVPVALAADIPGSQQSGNTSSDGAGGVLFAWDDYRTPSNSIDVYLQGRDSSGARPSGWPATGVLVSTGPSLQYAPKVAPDGHGGAYVGFGHEAGSTTYAKGQHVLASGAIAPNWPTTGWFLALYDGADNQTSQIITEDGIGGAVCYWNQTRCYAQKMQPDGLVATEVSFAAAEIEPGLVRISWFGAAHPDEALIVERRTTSTGWESIGSALTDGDGLIVYEDNRIEPGNRYAYRLHYRSPDGERRTGEAWVDVPATAVLALHSRGVVEGALDAAFTLPSRDTAELSVHDVSGRRLISRDLSTLPAGRHTIALAARGALAPGVYWLRLTHGQESVSTRVALLR